MSQPYVGEIRIFAGNFAPVGWMFCDGQLLPISENETLFNLIGTTYGGDGFDTFALPDLRGRVPVHQTSPFPVSQPPLGEKYGDESVTLTLQQIPPHVHPHAAAVGANTTTPLGKLVADTGPARTIYADGQGASPASALAITSVGAGQPHQNMMPFLGVNFIISLFGIFPPPS
jgi:microcystin-dependent protein